MGSVTSDEGQSERASEPASQQAIRSRRRTCKEWVGTRVAKRQPDKGRQTGSQSMESMENMERLESVENLTPFWFVVPVNTTQ